MKTNYRQLKAYIVSKPIQFINILNIDKFDENNSHLFLINSFVGAKELYDYLLKTSHWNQIIFLNNDLSAYQYIIKHKNLYNYLYTYSDFGIKIRWYFHRLKGINIYLYEEGYYSYQNNQNCEFPFLHKLFFALIDCTLHPQLCIGGSKCVKSIYVYRPQLYTLLKPNSNAKPLKFKDSLFDNVLKHKVLNYFVYKSDFDYTNKKVLLYISYWNINDKIQKILDQYVDAIKILKPHPKLLITDEFSKMFDIVIPNKYMAEMVIAYLLDKVCELTIVHDNSTSIFNFIGHPKIKEINIGTTNLAYNSIYSSIMKLSLDDKKTI